MKNVSVIIPTFNRARLVIEAIDSVLKQDVTDCEIQIIVVDDGSTDGTREAIKCFGNRVTYIYQENSGAGAARNRGLREAKSEWIAFLDSDDRWLPYKLSLQFRILQAFPTFRAVHTNFYTFDGITILIEDGLGYWLELFANSGKTTWADIYSKQHCSSSFDIYHNNTSFDIYTGNTFRALLNTPCLSCCTLLAHRDCLSANIRFAETYRTWEDYWFFCKFSEVNDIIFADIPTMGNRAHNGERLTGMDLVQILKYHLDVCDRIFFPSFSPNKPLLEEIQCCYRKLHLDLFKEYVKRGRTSDAQQLLHSIRQIGAYKLRDRSFLLFRILSLLPPEAISLLAELKQMAAERRCSS